MEIIREYEIEGKFYELYQAASGDYCVAVTDYEGNSEAYNIGNYEDALAFILKVYEVIYE